MDAGINSGKAEVRVVPNMGVAVDAQASRHMGGGGLRGRPP